ncbi:MAG TPA: protein translocase subunit SecF [Streptosporangiaceae bacterium]|nr:protein translocase subunit SecF [Streptosporangiaceae bacterium]
MARLAPGDAKTSHGQRGERGLGQDHPEGGVMSRLGNIGGRLYRGEVSFDFVGRQKMWYTISGVILVISVAALLIFHLNFSVDFKGGDIYKFTPPASVHLTQTQVASTAINAGANPSTIVQQVGGKSWSVQTAAFGHTGTQYHVLGALAKLAHLSNSQVSLQSVGPSWGGQISQKALEALIAFLIVIVLYLSVAFEWRMAVSALVALIHDIVITIGVYALVHFEVSPATVIGLLTILGYSLYDTVVVFDKVRENTAGLLATRRTRYSEAANLALNQTLVRSINTSLIALLPVVAILAVSAFLLGNGELKDLSLVLFVGMLSGTYSSICIATPVLADLKERQPEYRQLAKQIAQRATSAKRQAKVAVAKASASVGTGNGGSAAGVGDDDVDDDVLAEAEDQPGGTQDETAASVSAGRPVGGSTGGRAVPGSRQQPRRSTAAQRRPQGKKKRR